MIQSLDLPILMLCDSTLSPLPHHNQNKDHVARRDEYKRRKYLILGCYKKFTARQEKKATSYPNQYKSEAPEWTSHAPKSLVMSMNA